MATLNSHTTRAVGTILTAAIYNADHENHITNAQALNTELANDVYRVGGTDVSIPDGGTGASSVAIAQANLGILDTAAVDARADARIAALRPIGLETIFIPAGVMTPAVTSGPAAVQLESTTNKQNQIVLDFDGAAIEYAHFNVRFPKSWDEGTVTYYAIWRSSAVDTDAVAWFLQGAAMSDGDSTDPAWGTAIEVDDAAQSSATKTYISAISAAVTIAGVPVAGDLVAFRLYRDPTDAADLMVEDARLIGIVILYNTDTTRDD